MYSHVYKYSDIYCTPMERDNWFTVAHKIVRIFIDAILKYIILTFY